MNKEATTAHNLRVVGFMLFSFGLLMFIVLLISSIFVGLRATSVYIATAALINSIGSLVMHSGKGTRRWAGRSRS